MDELDLSLANFRQAVACRHNAVVTDDGYSQVLFILALFDAKKFEKAMSGKLPVL